MTPILLAEGQHVIPGDVLVLTHDGLAETEDINNAVNAGAGAVIRRCLRRGRDADAPTALERRVIATRVGIVHWSEDGQEVSVVSKAAVPLAAPSPVPAVIAAALTTASEVTSSSAVTASILRDAALGAKSGDTIHLRVTRITPTFASGDVIAIRGQWCCNRTGAFSGFRGMLRAEDIKPFKPTKDKLLADPPAESMRPGDVVVATVISQTDAKVYQLSTVAEHCGVIESTVPAEESDGHRAQKESDDIAAATIPSVRPTKKRIALLPVPYKRTIMKHPVTGATYKKWTPLVQ
ncbi:exosome component CSL4, putative [Bodo saltans]|uniref:Exosome component CSL4, putative n=1 Tax=Bodo saltans TaxID=75058 RepID=A0A0S4IM15_BODSA|nr:exosome component CSL4, putative [Bodo saltans]|eukprot:CUF35433.1 exosome component CSL4, putative [Bodo saltans]